MMHNQKLQPVNVPEGSVPMPPDAGGCFSITCNSSDIVPIQADTDFLIESYGWINSIRGPEYIDQLARRITQEGPEAVLAEVICPTMSDDERRVYEAVIKYLLLSSNGLATNGLATNHCC